MTRRIPVCLISTLLIAGSTALAVAQSTPSPTAKPDTPATQPSPGDGTKPGNEGSTGWTGGTGGSYTGTSPHAATPGSKTEQPETVKGLNPQPSNSTTMPSR